MDKFKNRLRIALDRTGMRQVELAKRVGISKGTISQYLSGLCEPKTDKVYLIAEALHVSPAWLMGFDEPDYRISDDVIIEKINKLSHSSKEMLKQYIEFLYMSENNMFSEKEEDDVQG